MVPRHTTTHLGLGHIVSKYMFQCRGEVKLWSLISVRFQTVILIQGNSESAAIRTVAATVEQPILR